MSRNSLLCQFLRLLLIQGACQVAVDGIRLMGVHVPLHVPLGQDADLECAFDLEGETLYAVKWWKDGEEFYQYVPGHYPPNQFFPLPGVRVDLQRSSRRVVALKAAELVTSGDYRCEVSGEAPDFRTVSDGGTMHVVVLPEEGPVITGGRASYSVGEDADLLCRSAPSNPPAQLSWTINGRQVPQHYLRNSWTRKMKNQTEIVVLQLRFRIAAHHFVNGNINIQCVATVASEYERSDGHTASDDGADAQPPMVGARTDNNPATNAPEPDNATQTGQSSILAAMTAVAVAVMWPVLLQHR